MQERFLTENIGELEKSFGFDYYHPDGRLLDEKTVKDCTKNEIKVNAWAVNELDLFLKLKNYDMYGIITNYPDLMIKNR